MRPGAPKLRKKPVAPFRTFAPAQWVRRAPQSVPDKRCECRLSLGLPRPAPFGLVHP
jgi:hypothetical protein